MHGRAPLQRRQRSSTGSQDAAVRLLSSLLEVGSGKVLHFRR